jgi:hypothetical protein
MGQKLTTLLKAVAGLNLLQAVLRLMFFYIMITGGIGQFLEVAIDAGTLQILGVAFLILGVGGLISVYGFIKGLEWGVKAVLVVNILTILLDLWGYFVQSSAFMGLIVPVLTLVILVKERKNMERSNGGSFAEQPTAMYSSVIG